MESTEIGLKLSRQSWAPSLKRGVTRAIFHLVGKQPLCIDKLINLVNGCTKTGETSFRTFTLISSAPVAFEDDKLSINFCTVMRGILNWKTKLSTVEETNFSSFEESEPTYFSRVNSKQPSRSRVIDKGSNNFFFFRMNVLWLNKQGKHHGESLRTKTRSILNSLACDAALYR